MFIETSAGLPYDTPVTLTFTFFFFSSRRRHTRSVSAFLLNRSSDLAAEGLTKRSAVGFLLRSLIMFQTFISRHNSNFFSDKLVLTSVLQLLRHLFYRHLKLHRQRYILIV